MSDPLEISPMLYHLDVASLDIGTLVVAANVRQFEALIPRQCLVIKRQISSGHDKHSLIRGKSGWSFMSATNVIRIRDLFRRFQMTLLLPLAQICGKFPRMFLQLAVNVDTLLSRENYALKSVLRHGFQIYKPINAVPDLMQQPITVNQVINC